MLRGSVLVVEDEYLVAVDLAATLAEAEWQVIGPAHDVPTALKLVSEAPVHAALVDFNLGGVTADPIVSELQQRGIPFVILSGYGRGNLPDSVRDVPLITKPFEPGQVLSALERIRAP